VIERRIRVVLVERAVLVVMMRFRIPMHLGVREVAAAVHLDPLMSRYSGLEQHRNQQDGDEEEIAHEDSAYQM
jgi:hypothetical protein